MGIPLLASHDVTGHVHLIIGSNSLAGARCVKSIDGGAEPILFIPPGADVHYALQKRIDQGQVRRLDRAFDDDDLDMLGRAEIDGVVDAVFITTPGGSRNPMSRHISTLCRRRRIPVNVVDAPSLCSFTLLSVHSDGPLHIGISTSGKGCRLAARLRREVAASLPAGIGAAIERLGAMRRRIWEEDHRQHDLAMEASDDDTPGQRADFNRLVPAGKDEEEERELLKTRRMRWLSQVYEYWPLRRLAGITDADIDNVLAKYTAPSSGPVIHDGVVGIGGAKARIILAGSGPGSPHLLTIAAHYAIKNASLILADKLVPAAVLDLVPRRTPVHIARKFPGNADAAQDELLELGLAALRRGETVLRLKQGDPYLYGRGGEEVRFFEAHGFETVVIPGVTSALAAPLLAGIPATQRGIADQLLVCTGTGQKGALPSPPPYVKGQTVVFLMALHRLGSLVQALTNTGPAMETAVTTAKSDPIALEPTSPVMATTASSTTKATSLAPSALTSLTTETEMTSIAADTAIATAAKVTSPTVPKSPMSPAAHSKVTESYQTSTKDVPERLISTSSPWPLNTPCAVIERASCADQRIIRSSLEHVVAAIEAEGSRPPGLLVLGASCEALRGCGGSRWMVEEGFRAFEDLAYTDLAGLTLDIGPDESHVSK